MRFNWRKIASTIINHDAKNLRVRYFTAELPGIDGVPEPILITLSAKTLWGVLLLQTHWFEELTDKLGVKELTPYTNKELLPGLLEAFDVPLFSGYGIRITRSQDFMDFGEQVETIDVVPLTNFPE